MDTGRIPNVFLNIFLKLTWVRLRLTNNLNFTTCLSNKLILFNSSRETPFICWSSLKSSCLFCTLLGRVGGCVGGCVMKTLIRPSTQQTKTFRVIQMPFMAIKSKTIQILLLGLKLVSDHLAPDVRISQREAFQLKKRGNLGLGPKWKWPNPPKIKLKLF